RLVKMGRFCRGFGGSSAVGVFERSATCRWSVPLTLGKDTRKKEDNMAREDDLARVLKSKLVAVIRAESGDLLVDVAEALLAGGVEVMEVTFTVPRAVQVIER